jgi:hypothetical protein
MADFYWVGGTGNWSAYGTHWATATGGGTFHGNAPTSSDNVYFDANSFSSADQTVTVDTAAYCLDMDWTGATNTPEMAGASSINISGSLTTIAAMVWSHTGYCSLKATGNVTTNGLSINCLFVLSTAANITLIDALDVGTKQFLFEAGTLDTNGQALTCGAFNLTTAGAKTLTLGASIINCVSLNYSGSNLTITANTATINVTGTGAVALGSADWNGADFNLNGTAHALSGSPTGIGVLTLKADATQTVTFEAGNNLQATTVALDGDTSHTHTVKSATANSLTQITATTLTHTYCTITDMILADIGGDVLVTCAGTTGGTFAGADNTYGDITIEGAGNYPLIITGDNIFDIFTVDASDAAKTIKFTDGSTQNVNDFQRDNGGTNIITLTGTSTAGWAIVNDGGGVVSLDYMDISYSTAT